MGNQGLGSWGKWGTGSGGKWRSERDFAKLSPLRFGE